MKILVALLFAAIVPPADAEKLSIDIRCFSDSTKNIQLEFRTYEDQEIGWIGGQVRYRQSKTFIPLVFRITKTLTEIQGRPWVFEHTWLEIVDGAITGQYRLVSQGANVYGFSYSSRKKGKTIQLSEQSFPDENGKCTWQ